MASANRFTVLLAIATTIIPAVAMAAEHVVGDAQGWNISVDYKKWAAGEQFNVGDILVFTYNKSHDSVIQVRSGPDFQDCIPLGDILDSGNDTVVLDTAGKIWFISGVASHCAEFNQKLVVNVVAEGAPAPVGHGPFAPISNPNTNAAYGLQYGFVAAAVSVALAVVVLA